MKALRWLKTLALAGGLALGVAALTAGPALACGPTRTVTPAKKPTENLATATIPIEGMSCGNCADKIREALMQVDGVFDALVSHETAEARVSYDSKKVTPKAIASAIEKAGYKPGSPKTS